MENADRMSKTTVRRSRKYELRDPKLPDTPQSLELRGIDKLPSESVEGLSLDLKDDQSMNGIPQSLDSRSHDELPPSSFAVLFVIVINYTSSIWRTQ